MKRDLPQASPIVGDFTQALQAQVFKVSAAYIEWAHGPGAEDGQPLATELCGLPVKNKQTLVPLDRRDLLEEIRSVAELYVGGRPGDNYSRAGRVLKRVRAALDGEKCHEA